jgi:hypothetical protein
MTLMQFAPFPLQYPLNPSSLYTLTSDCQTLLYSSFFPPELKYCVWEGGDGAGSAGNAARKLVGGHLRDDGSRWRQQIAPEGACRANIVTRQRRGRSARARREGAVRVSNLHENLDAVQRRSHRPRRRSRDTPSKEGIKLQGSSAFSHGSSRRSRRGKTCGAQGV